MRNRWALLAGAGLLAVVAVAAWWAAGLGAGPGGTTPATAEPTTESGATAGPQPPTSPASAATGPATGHNTPTPEPGDPAPGPATAPPPGPAATSTAAPGEVAPPTPSPATAPEGGAPLVGSTSRTDASGDLTDSAGRPPPDPQPAADLTEVALSGDGEELVVEFTLAGAVPPRATSLVWSLDIWLGEELAYSVTAQQVEGRVVAGVFDWASGEQVAPPQPPEISGRTVTMRVPRDLLARVDGPFRWQALAQADGGYEDYVPADGVLDWFPAHGP